MGHKSKYWDIIYFYVLNTSIPNTVKQRHTQVIAALTVFFQLSG